MPQVDNEKCSVLVLSSTDISNNEGILFVMLYCSSPFGYKQVAQRCKVLCSFVIH